MQKQSPDLSGNSPGCSEGRIARMSSDSVSFSHVTEMSVSCEIELCDSWDETISDRSEALELLCGVLGGETD